MDEEQRLAKSEQVVEFTPSAEVEDFTEPAEEKVEFESDIDFDFDTPSLVSVPAEEPVKEVALSEEDTSFDLDNDESFFDDIAGID